jgi:hypothetical protein
MLETRDKRELVGVYNTISFSSVLDEDEQRMAGYKSGDSNEEQEDDDVNGSYDPVAHISEMRQKLDRDRFLAELAKDARYTAEKVNRHDVFDESTKDGDTNDMATADGVSSEDEMSPLGHNLASERGYEEEHHQHMLRELAELADMEHEERYQNFGCSF